MSHPIVTYPKPYSIAAVTLARALEGESIEENRADNANRRRFSARVRYLETVHGWLFEREQALGQAGYRNLITRYWLNKAVIAWAGSEGQEYAMKVLKLEAKKVAAREAATSPTAEIKSAPLNSLKQENNTCGCNAQGVLEEPSYG
jgi:hypothetical protein